MAARDFSTGEVMAALSEIAALEARYLAEYEAMYGDEDRRLAAEDPVSQAPAELLAAIERSQR